jgi:capsular polysaccharide biosynthesis protein
MMAPDDTYDATASSRADRKARKKAKRLLVRQQRLADPESGEGSSEQATKPSRWIVGRSTYFHRPPPRDVLVEDIPLTAEALEDAFVSARTSGHAVEGSEDVRTYSGAVYRSDGRLVEEFIAHEQQQAPHRAARMRNPVSIEPNRLSAAKPIDATCVYLGDLSRHFGHFLLESLARAWHLTRCHPAPLVVFHGGAQTLAALGPFAHTIFRALDVDPSKVIMAHEDLRVRQLILPAAQYLNTVKGSPGMCVVFDHLREKLLASQPARSRTPGKVYMTRRNLSPTALAGGERRGFLNEHEAEDLFRRRGYEVVSPENLPFEEQVAIVANATHVAGLSGAALHLILLNSRPDTKLIELRTKPAINQMIINSIRGVEAFHIPCVAARGARQAIALDIGAVEAAMREIDP